MIETHLQQIDTRMMRAIYHILTLSSVSRAAALLEISQPAASQYLRRWRGIVGDPLLVRSASQMVRTDRGDQVLNKIAGVLLELEGIASPKDLFNAGLSRRKLSVFAANSLGPFFIPKLVEMVRQQAPHMQMDMRPIMPESQLIHELQAGEMDLAIGNWPTPPTAMRYAKLFESNIVCVVRSEHPVAGQRHLTLADYLNQDHLSPTPASSMSISPIDSRLSAINMRRRIAVSIPEFSMIPQVLASSDLVFTTAKALAEQFARDHSFTVLSAPKEFGQMVFYMLWHDRLHLSAYGEWTRGMVKQVSDALGF